MASARSRWLTIAAVAAAAVAAFLIWRGCRPAPTQTPVTAQSFTLEGVAVHSPDLAVGPAEVQATSYRGYTDWACLLECREPEGCRAEVRLVLDYAGDGTGGRLIVTATLDANQGETMRIGRTQRPPAAAVEVVNRLDLEVVRRLGPDAPTPFVVF